MSEQYEKALKTLCEREVYWLRQRLECMKGKKIAIFAAGHYARRFYNWLKDEYGVEAECFIDNNPRFAGQTACGKPILHEPWKTTPNFQKDFFVIISTKDSFYREIAIQLDNVCASGGGGYMSSDAFQAVYFWERFKKMLPLLKDDFSKVTALAVYLYWLTYDTNFIQYVYGQYFAVNAFACPMGEIVVDAGAFVGDTTEEYIKRSFGSCKIYAFEPSEKLTDAITGRIGRLTSEWALANMQISHVLAGVGAKTGKIRFTQTDISSSSYVSDEDVSGSEIKIYALDDYFKDKQPPTVNSRPLKMRFDQ